jgi:hypothetical protein
MSFYGKEYIVVDEFVWCGERYLRCIDETDPKNRIITLLAAITNYYPDQLGSVVEEMKAHFTIQGLVEAETILGHVLGR